MFKFFRGAYVKRMIRMNALRKGLLGGHPMWRAVWAVSALRKMWSRVSKKGEAPITFSESLGEGEAWALVHVPENSRRGRGEGRRYAIGPKRQAPRFSAIGPAAAVAAARHVFEAPDAARVNQILGVDVVEDEPPSRRDRKRAAAAAKSQAKADRKATTKQAKKDERAAKAQASSDHKAAERAAKQARAEAKAEAKRAKAELRAAERAARRSGATIDEVPDAGSLQKSDA
jgi:flagellar biosynthesis GTPase FlhF